MEILLNLPNFIFNIFTLTTILVILSGVFLGILLGALPGFGSAQSLAILFPLTFVMSTSDSLIFLLAVYSAAEYGGSIPAILIKTPGTPAEREAACKPVEKPLPAASTPTNITSLLGI